MAGYISRVILNSKIACPLSVLFRRYSSQVISKSDVHGAREELSELSTLFVPGRRGSEMYQIVKPFVDIKHIADNLGNLKLSCDYRGIVLDLDYFLKIAREWSRVKNDHSALVEKEQEYSSELIRLTALDLKEEAEIISMEKQQIINKIIVVKNKVHDIEDIFMPLLQKVPHILHPITPLQFNEIDVCHHEPPNIDAEFKSHTEIAKTLFSLEFSNYPSISYFLSGKLSQLDFAIQMYFMDKMCSLDFTALSCADFCKSFIIEAIGFDPYSSQDCIQVKSKGNTEVGQKLNLVGGASLETFCAYLTNMNTAKSNLPLKYFSIGRHYNSTYLNSKHHDLFSVVQSTNVHCLILSQQSSADEFDFLLNSFLACYTELNIPFRTVNIAARNLTIAESRKSHIELWSPALKAYIPVAYVSQHDDFISKRLQITYGEQHSKEGYCSIIEGTALNVPVLIGCIMENFQTRNCDFNIPDVLKIYI